MSANPIALIPAYNAAHLVAPVIREAARHLPVVVVDDGSSDDTAAIAADAGARVIRQVPNQGKGVALRNGFTHALESGIDAVVTLDADGQHDPAEIPKLLEAWQRERPEMVVGARDYDEMPFVRRLSNKVGRRSLSWALGADIPDNQSGYRVIGERLMRAMLDSGESGFEFEVWMIVLCVRNHWPIAWVPIRTIYEGAGSHIRPLDHVKSYFRMMRAIRSERRNWSAAADA